MQFVFIIHIDQFYTSEKRPIAGHLWSEEKPKNAKLTIFYPERSNNNANWSVNNAVPSIINALQSDFNAIPSIINANSSDFNAKFTIINANQMNAEHGEHFSMAG
ncbi:hypothetical protein [Bacillus sp. FJAT-27245]|uniref:hypothetical protein n=1 Tax=Bacillus sp. FJAT-27245 TaxID=1684144 RepID=UPI0006A76A7F|nr:hypothetical protein [Bacillus sp. FJAT-27245]